MSSAKYLTKQKIERIEHFLKKGSIEQSCKKFKVQEPAFRESIIKTAKALHSFYIKPNEHYLGRLTSTIDIFLNKELILNLIQRNKKREKPNLVESDNEPANEQEIINVITNSFPSNKQTNSYLENSLRIEGALCVFRNFNVTNK